MKCPDCEGAGYMEYEHGLIRIGCSACGGTGQKADTMFKVVNCAIPLAAESTEMIEVAPGRYEVPDGNTGNARTGKGDSSSRVKNPGKPQQRKPRKPGGKATKKTI